MVTLESLEDLRTYIRGVLCRHADLELATPIYESLLTVRGQAVAVEFTLLGPRSVRLSALWEAASGRILFYDQDLRRFDTAEIDPRHAPRIAEFVPQPIPVKSLWKGK